MRLNALLATLVVAYPFGARAEISYFVTPDPDTREFNVTVVAKANAPQTKFCIPAWCPGYYQIAEYQRGISLVVAHDGAGAVLPVEHIDSRVWTVDAPVGAVIKFEYEVLGNDAGLGFFAAYLDNRVGFINGASTFMYVDGRLTEPDRLTIHQPNGWDIATGMERNDDGFVAASGYDELIDNPIQLGAFIRKKFMVEGIPFEAIYVSKGEPPRANLDVETARLKQVSAPAIRMFGGAAFKHYTYIVHLAVGNFGGGLEHRASTCIAVNNSNELNLDDLAAHENFHAWNVKQIRPFVLGPFDYTQPDRTANLWWMEGVTDYYAKILTYRSGLENSDWLLNEIRAQYEELQNSQARSHVTLEDCSRKCWDSSGFGVGDLSYYTKGFLVGAILDASIRAQTDGKKSLDDVMRLLFAKYRLPNPGLPEDGIIKAIDEVVGTDASNSLYHEMTQTTDELPYDVLRNIGIVALTPGHNHIVPGYSAQNGVVTSVGAEAGDAGLRVGDKITGVFDAPWLGFGIAPAGYAVQVDRNGAQLRLSIKYSFAPSQESDLVWDPTAGNLATRLRQDWLQRPDGSKKTADQSAEGDKHRPR
ncbi:MAG: M61 family metallopeptidase [Fimbriimonadaceae bacterium]